MIYFQIFTTFRYKSLKNSDMEGRTSGRRPLRTAQQQKCSLAAPRRVGRRNRQNERLLRRKIYRCIANLRPARTPAAYHIPIRLRSVGGSRHSVPFLERIHMEKHSSKLRNRAESGIQAQHQSARRFRPWKGHSRVFIRIQRGVLKSKTGRLSSSGLSSCGESGIRTRGTVTRTSV